MKNQTTTCCRQCGKPMASYVQPLADFQIKRGRKPQTYVTCDQSGCALEGYTFAAATYAERDLTEYLKPRCAGA